MGSGRIASLLCRTSCSCFPLGSCHDLLDCRANPLGADSTQLLGPSESWGESCRLLLAPRVLVLAMAVGSGLAFNETRCLRLCTEWCSESVQIGLSHISLCFVFLS